MYPISRSYDVAFRHPSSLGRVSVVVLLICPACNINVVASLLSFICCVSVCLWCICTGIASAFISSSFSDRIKAAMLCFPVTTISCLISTSCCRLDSCSTLICLNPKALHTSCIRIGLQQPSEKYFPPIHIPKSPLKNSSFGPETAIDGPSPSNEYTG